MSKIKLKPCPFCGGEAQIRPLMYQGKDPVAAISGRTIVCTQCYVILAVSWACDDFQAAEAWNRRADNKPIRQSCKSCKHYTPDPNYRNGDMGNCRYLEKIWEKPFYVNEARAECEHFQAAERRNENGNET